MHYFEKFNETFEPVTYRLTLNYRSVTEIVTRAEKMITSVSRAIDFPRMKNETSLRASRVDGGETTDFANPLDCPGLARDAFSWLRDRENENENGNGNGDGPRGASVALLCRTNAAPGSPKSEKGHAGYRERWAVLGLLPALADGLERDAHRAQRSRGRHYRVQPGLHANDQHPGENAQQAVPGPTGHIAGQGHRRFLGYR